MSALFSSRPELYILSYPRTETAQASTQPAPDITEYIMRLDEPAKVVPVPEARAVTPLHCLGKTSNWIDCPLCHHITKTEVDEEEFNTTREAFRYNFNVVCTHGL